MRAAAPPVHSPTSTATQRHWVVAATAGADTHFELEITVGFGLTQHTEATQATHIRLSWDELLIVAETLGCSEQLLAAAPRSGEATLEDFNGLFAQVLVGQSFEANAEIPGYQAVELVLAERKGKKRLVDGSSASAPNNDAAASDAAERLSESVPHQNQSDDANVYPTTRHTQTCDNTTSSWSRRNNIAERGVSSDEDSDDEMLGENALGSRRRSLHRQRLRARSHSFPEESRQLSSSKQSHHRHHHHHLQ
eukprot:COSAG03_NODE_6979_length_980_cov_1.292849_2_plen_250_part_01